MWSKYSVDGVFDAERQHASAQQARRKSNVRLDSIGENHRLTMTAEIRRNTVRKGGRLLVVAAKRFLIPCLYTREHLLSAT